MDEHPYHDPDNFKLYPIISTWIVRHPRLLFALVLCLAVWAIISLSQRLISQADRHSPNNNMTGWFARLWEARRPYRPRVNTLEVNTESTNLAPEKKVVLEETQLVAAKSIKQPYDAFLVLDIEGTCQAGTSFNYPNEIIEFPVCLMRWKDKDANGRASQLEIVAEFRSFVRPVWRPTLSQFCTNLTGITQTQVDKAPHFPEVMTSFSRFLADYGLIDRASGERIARFCWCSDGPWDIRDFVIKQCFISKFELPEWMKGDVLDVRRAVSQLAYVQKQETRRKQRASPNSGRLSLSIPFQLKYLSLAPFEGRQHSGIDDTRNISRILAELGRRGVKLEPNTYIRADRRWAWMGRRPGQIVEELIS